MDYKDLLSKTASELTALISEERAKLQALRLKAKLNQLKDVREIREIRKDIARMTMALDHLKVQK